MNTKRHIIHQSRPGYLLLVVLVFLFLTALVVTSLVESSLRNLRSAAAASARDDLRLEAFSAMEIALATLSEIKELDEGLHSPSQGWGSPMSYAPIQWPDGTVVEVTITDETGRLPLDPPDRDVLKQLFDQMGIDFGESDELIDAYLDWTDDDDLERLNGAEEDYYERQTPSRTPPNAPITSYEDFRYIKGFDTLFFDEKGLPNSLFQRFKDATSLSHGFPVNINTAPPALVSMLEETAGLDPRKLEDIKLGLDRIPGTNDDGWATGGGDSDSPVLGNSESIGYDAHVFRISARVSRGQQQFQLTALVDDGTDSPSSEGGGGTNRNDGNTQGGSGNNNTDGGEFIDFDENFNEIKTPIGASGGERDSENQEHNGGTGESEGPRILYTNGEWRFLELTENGAEDG